VTCVDSNAARGLDEKHDATLDNLAKKWGAVRDASKNLTLQNDAMMAYERVSMKYLDTLDRLGTV